MSVIYRDDLYNVDWLALKATLAADRFDNGRSPEQLQRSFANSFAICLAWSDAQIVGTTRVLSDGVCNAYLVDVWTRSDLRRQGIARTMIERVIHQLAGQHVYLQADSDTSDFYRRISFIEQPTGMSRVIGNWLDSTVH
jgi:GNAT superfamily N-acetyltransferase